MDCYFVDAKQAIACYAIQEELIITGRQQSADPSEGRISLLLR